MKSSKRDEIKERKSERKINFKINLFGILFNNDSLWSRLVECSHFKQTIKTKIGENWLVFFVQMIIGNGNGFFYLQQSLFIHRQ